MAASNEGKATYGSTSKKKPASKKPSGSKKPSTPKPSGGYDWGDGRAVHSKSLEDHNAAKGGVATYGLTPNQPLDAPLTAAQAYSMAQAAANRTYAPQLQANAQLQANTPAWYQNYITQTGKQQEAAQAYAQPLLDTAQTAVTNAGQTTPGLDPSSPQFEKEQQAAVGRQAIAQLAASMLGNTAAATNTYFGGQANIAARELPQAQAGLVYQAGQLGSQRQDAATAAYGDIRTNEQNASLARQTLGLNTAKAASDAAYDSATLEQKTQDKKDAAKAKGDTPNKYGIPAAQWNRWSSSHRQRVIDAFDKKNGTSGDKDAKDAEKKATAIKTSTGKIKVDVQNTIDKWNSYVGKTTSPNPDAPVDPKTNPERKLTPKDIKAVLGEKTDSGMIHVALLVRAGKPLDKAAIDYLHSKDPNIRIPREWLKGKQKTSTLNRPNRPAAPKNDQSGYGNRPT